MRVIDGQRVESRKDFGRKRLCNVDYQRCTFEDCVFSIVSKPRKRSIMENVRFTDCSTRGCTVEAAILRNVEVNGLTTHGLLQAWGAVFDRVVLRGRLGRLMLSPVVQPGVASRETQLAFDAANRTFYEGVDWALDVTEAEVQELDLRGVPGHLVRRDPETQMFVTRDAALSGAWGDLALKDTYWPVALDNLVREGWDSVVLVAPKRAKNFAELLAGLQRLRDAGLAS